MFGSNRISQRYIQKSLGSDCKIKVRQVVTSTNTVMKSIAGKTASEFDVLIASKQTMGRGRRGRRFHSPKGTGIYMSILLKIKKDSNPLLITTDAAVCCAEVLEKMSGETAQIKWVNDIYIREKKVCGILTEGIGEYAVLGIGINVLPPKEGFPEDIKDRAGAVFEKREPHIREKVVIEILREFMKIYTAPNRDKLLMEYKNRSMIIGKEILILNENGDEKAVAIEVADDYSLIVKRENGEICNLNSGDVSIRI